MSKKSASSTTQSSMTDLIQGYYTVYILDALRREGVFEFLSKGITPERISENLGFDKIALLLLLDYVSLYTDFIHKTDVGYKVDVISESALFSIHLVDQYAGGYGPCLAALTDILRGNISGSECVDRRRHAQAFSIADRAYVDEDVLRLLTELRIENLLDLGCGTAGLLIEYLTRQPTSRAIGIDSSEQAIKIAGKRVEAEALSDRIRLINGDVKETTALMTKIDRENIQCIVANSITNEFFDVQPSNAIDEWLSSLKRAFPNRFMVLSDYYGQLGHTKTSTETPKRALFHDVAQLLSGQGIPPRNIQCWKVILERNDCTLVKAFEGDGGNLGRFIFLLQL